MLGKHLDTDGMECLLKIPSPLKKLKFWSAIRGVDPRLDDLPKIIYELLHKHSLTLEDLSMNFSSQKRTAMDFKLPVFPAMKSFGIYGIGMFKKIEFESSPGSGNFGRINYQVCFPVFEKLQFHNYDFSIVASFLPPEDHSHQVVKSVKKVGINFWRYQKTELARNGLYIRLLDIFPNAKISVSKQ